jgi:hypothetical protein
MPENVGLIVPGEINGCHGGGDRAAQQARKQEVALLDRDGLVFAHPSLVQIELTSEPVTGQGRPAPGEGRAPLQIFEEEQELLDDFLSRLQSIIRRAPVPPPASLDDTRPARFPPRRS